MHTNVTLVVPVLWFLKDQIRRNSYPALLFLTCLFLLSLCIENSDCKNCVIILFRKLEGISLEANCQLSRYCHYTINIVLCTRQWEHTTSSKTFFMQFNVFCMLCHMTHCLSWKEVPWLSIVLVSSWLMKEKPSYTSDTFLSQQPKLYTGKCFCLCAFHL
jgi:hypothetical protein